MAGSALRAFAISGRQAAAALDWLHVHAAVQGVIEGEQQFTVFVTGPLPPPPFPELQVDEVAIAPGPPPTGLEHDRVQVLAPDLIVRPPWLDPPAGFGGIDLVVPRGGAFGSGEHESTQAALLCLHALWGGPESFVDVGTGSGILARYAMLRDCPDIQACDIDAPSVAAAAELLPQARVVLGGPEQLVPAAAVAANMTGTELEANLAAILALWAGGGPLVLAGMRAHEVGAIERRLPAPPTHRVHRDPFFALGLN